jgi:hypothetical protein
MNRSEILLPGILIICIVNMLLFLRCSNVIVTGGGTEGGNTICGAVINDDATVPAMAKVLLIPSDYNPGTESHETSIASTFTTSDGSYSFEHTSTGNYCIEIIDIASGKKSLITGVKVTGKDKNLSVDTLRKPGSAMISIPENESSNGSYIYVPGTTIYAPVEVDTGYMIVNDLPANQLPSIRYVSSYDSAGYVLRYGVEITPEDTIVVANTLWKYARRLYLNTTATGAGVTESVAGFPVLIRLNQYNFDFSQANTDGSDIRFFRSDTVALPFEIEQWNITAGQAEIWVKLDTIKGNDSTQFITMYYGNPAATPFTDSKMVFDTSKGFFAGYHFAGNLNDATVNSYNGVDSNTINVDNGIIGNARSFNGSGYVNLGDLPDRPEGTISFWFNPEATVDTSMTVSQGIWGKASNDFINFTLSLRGKDFYTDSNLSTVSPTGAAGNLIGKQEDGTGGYYFDSKTADFTSESWNFVTWSWGERGNFIYVNGVLENSVSNKFIPVSGNANDEVGRSFYDLSTNISKGSARYFNGILDEFRIDKVARNADWVRLCFMNQRKDDKLVVFKMH